MEDPSGTICAYVCRLPRMMVRRRGRTHAAFKALEALYIRSFSSAGGRVVKKTGDGFLLEFPAS